jgi:hypothetical protein
MAELSIKAQVQQAYLDGFNDGFSKKRKLENNEKEDDNEKDEEEDNERFHQQTIDENIHVDYNTNSLTLTLGHNHFVEFGITKTTRHKCSQICKLPQISSALKYLLNLNDHSNFLSHFNDFIARSVYKVIETTDMIDRKRLPYRAQIISETKMECYYLCLMIRKECLYELRHKLYKICILPENFDPENINTYPSIIFLRVETVSRTQTRLKPMFSCVRDNPIKKLLDLSQAKINKAYQHDIEHSVQLKKLKREMNQDSHQEEISFF